MSRSKKEQKLAGLEGMCSVLCEIQEAEEMRYFLLEILTPSEQKDLALRWELMKMLHEGIPQRRIAAELGISLCKITRGAKILKKTQSVSKRYLEEGETNESENST